MATVAKSFGSAEIPIPPPDGQSLVLDRVSWETYESLLADFEDRPNPHFFYDDGKLEIMVLSLSHELPNRLLAQLVSILAEELEIDIVQTGSITLKRPDVKKGFEPDSCFYVRNPDAIRGKRAVTLPDDPAPDLIIEVDVTSSSLPRFPIFATIGIQEVWRFDGATLVFHQLDGETYREVPVSSVFPLLDSATTLHFLETGLTEKSTVWIKSIRNWIRERRDS